MPGNQGGGAAEGRQLPLRVGQPERRGETALPDHPAVKGRSTPARLSARFPESGKCTSHLGFSLGMFGGENWGEEAERDSGTSRDFRRALKARAMSYRVPTQLANDHLFLSPPGSDDPATKAWDVCTACFYKAGGIPWRLAHPDPYVCYVGVSFHRLKTSDRHVVYSSTAQAFSTDIEGFVLMGEQIDWDKADGRIPHLNQQQALNLGKEILAEYRGRSG